MILSICNNPDVLSVVKYVRLVIDIIKIAVPIILIIVITVSLVRCVNEPEELDKELKNSVSRIIAAVLVFLIPTFVNILIDTFDAKAIDFASCINNATSEKIRIAYNKEAQKYVEMANETSDRSDYNFAISKVNKLEDAEEKEKLSVQLVEIKAKVEEKEEEARKMSSMFAKQFLYPLGSYTARLSSCYGGNDPVHKKIGTNHHAIDIGAPNHTPVYAASGGVVSFSRDETTFNSNSSNYEQFCNTNRSCGNVVMIKHPDGSVTKYCHMYPGSVLVKKGELVAAGQQIGEVGSTGCSTGPHLHFAISIGGVDVDPIYYIPLNVTNPDACF